MKTIFKILPAALTLAMAVCFNPARSQDCSTLAVSSVPNESRCMSTGYITVTATGGSGSYNYKVTGPVNTSYTSSNLITGLSAGNYTVTVKDIVTGCVRDQFNVIVTGTYTDPRFSLLKTDETCLGASNGTVTVTGLTGGRAPFVYTIISPSPMGVGTSNSTGVFTGLIGGEYAIQLRDSCGGIQTRRVTVNAYDWWIDAFTGNRNNCSNADFSFTLRDNRGNTNLSGSTFSAFQYGIVRSAGDTAWFNNRNFTFDIGTRRSLTMVVKDGCGNVKTTAWAVNPKPGVAGSVTTTQQSCNSFSASITGQSGLTNPQYSLFTSGGALVATNGSGSFSGFAKGSYYIDVRDNCYDTTIRRNFSVSQPMPFLSPTITITRTACKTFNAAAAGMTNFTSPTYRLYDASNTLIATQASGTFTNLTNGAYCMQIQDGCYDTTIQRCFTVADLVPSVNANVTITGASCTGATVTIGGQTNLNNPQYCLYDAANNLVACNSTGVFNNMPYGTYCMDVRNDASCYDTVIRRCVTVNRNIPSVGAVSLSSTFCSGFTATVGAQANLSNPTFQLKNSLGVVVATNATGVFTNLTYGSYCVDMINDPGCYDTTITRCFTATRPAPGAGSVTVNGHTCTTFNADFTGEVNITSPVYYLVNSTGDTIANNTTGTFTSIPFGTYTIRMRDNCYDTSIIRSFTGNPVAVNATVTAQASCTVNTTNIRVQFTTGFAPYTVQVYNPGNQLVGTVTTSSNPVWVNDLGGLPAGMQYRVVARDNCGNQDTKFVTPVVHNFNKSSSILAKCPSGLFQNGSSNLVVNVTSSLGAVYPIIVRKDLNTVSMSYTTQAGSQFTWVDLEPATYVVMYNLPGGCTNKVYDTLTVSPYAYPQLDKSAAYQCDNNNFSVGASVTGGSAPYSYQIIGSQPTTPSINTAPQASPVFNVTNGQTYSLIRLRAIDACGNATLNDVSILPLANVVVTASSTCFYNNITLSVDTVANATYTWYRKTSATDSVLLGSSQSYNIPYLLPTDTGTYIAKVSVNSGCLTKMSYFNINGSCGLLLPAKEVSLSARQAGDAAELKWVAKEETGVKEYVVERSAQGGQFRTIGTVSAKGNGTSSNLYMFQDARPESGANQYRLKVVDASGKFTYSNTVVLRWSGMGVKIYPNPAREQLNIDFSSTVSTDLNVALFSATGQMVQSKTVRNIQHQVIQFSRNSLKPGVYMVKMTNLKTGEVTTEKILFQ